MGTVKATIGVMFHCLQVIRLVNLSLRIQASVMVAETMKVAKSPSRLTNTLTPTLRPQQQMLVLMEKRCLTQANVFRATRETKAQIRVHHHRLQTLYPVPMVRLWANLVNVCPLVIQRALVRHL